MAVIEGVKILLQMEVAIIILGMDHLLAAAILDLMNTINNQISRTHPPSIQANPICISIVMTRNGSHMNL